MDFLPDVWVTCEDCGGTRYGEAVLACRVDGRHIADVLEMTVDDARAFVAGSSGSEGRVTARGAPGCRCMPSASATCGWDSPCARSRAASGSASRCRPRSTAAAREPGALPVRRAHARPASRGCRAVARGVRRPHRRRAHARRRRAQSRGDPARGLGRSISARRAALPAGASSPPARPPPSRRARRHTRAVRFAPRTRGLLLAALVADRDAARRDGGLHERQAR